MARVQARRLLTAEDLLTGSHDESGELWDGCYVVREPSGGWHGVLGSRISSRLLANEVLGRDGWVLDASGGYVVARAPDRVLSPDVSFIFRERFPTMPSKGFIEGAPDFCVEVRSPHDSWTAVVEKGGIWIAHGVGVVWCVDPFKSRVAVLRPGREPELCEPGAVATATPVLEFEMPVDELLEGIEPAA